MRFSLPTTVAGVTAFSGRYVYERNGAPVTLDETFGVDGASVHAVRDQPGGARMEVDAAVDDHGLTTGFRLQWTHAGEGHVRTRSVRYSLADGVLTSKIDSVLSVRSVAVDALLFPLLRVFQGAVIVAVAEHGTKGREVIIPDLHALTDPDRLLYPTVETRVANLLSTDADGIGTYTYEGSVYDANARFRIDAMTKQMVGYDFPQAEGVVFTVRRVDN